MKLKEIIIVSYRSITNQIIPISNNCIGLVGLNESGKTNILRAIRLFENEFVPTIKDKSKINDCLPKVLFSFDISVDKNSEAAQFCRTSWLENQAIPYSAITNKLICKQYIAYRQLEKEKDGFKKVKRYSCEYSTGLDGQYFKPKDEPVVPADISVKIEEKTFLLSNLQLIKKSDIPESYEQFFEPATEDDAKEIFKPLLAQFFEKNLPHVVFWEYDAKYLLPSEITYPNLTKDDDPYSNCAPLYNVFLLSERLKIK
ncbi:ATP-binding protein, partial [Candidatus Roizmanbacteria bacterium]|nr:ATP-binding protein [Candidatus Roizmanbacteria bacterium]